ncbi:MAG: ABC transporter permease [Ignavibacteria bacterium]|nr:MAG: ABC transporter permease [Ignavibacteria bacterium]
MTAAKSVGVIVEIVKKEFYQIRQDKRMMTVSILAPIMQVLLLGYAATTDIKNSNLAVCDMDKSAESRALIRQFTNTTYFIERYEVGVPGDVDGYIEHAKVSVALVIPAGFGRKLQARQTAGVQVVLDGADANSANVLLGYANQIVQSYSQSILLTAARAGGGQRIGRVLPEPRVWFNSDLRSTNYMVPGVVATVLMIITMTLTSLGVVREKEIGTLEQLQVTPIKPHELIIGKLIPFIMIGFFDVTVVLAIARFWFEVPMTGSLALLFGLSGLFILTTLGLGLFVSTIAKSQQQAMLIAQFFFFMPSTFLSGFTFPIANMPPVIQWLTYLIPLRYFLEIVRGIFLKGATLGELWPQASALLIFGIAILTMSVLRFRKRLE